MKSETMSSIFDERERELRKHSAADSRNAELKKSLVNSQNQLKQSNLFRRISHPFALFGLA